MGLRDRLHFSFCFVRHNKPHSLFIKASLWFTNQISPFKLISCTLSLLPHSVSKHWTIFFHAFYRYEMPTTFSFFSGLTETSLWRWRISEFWGSVLLKHFVKLCTGEDICSFIKLMAGTASQTISSSLPTLLDYPLLASSSTHTKIQDMNGNIYAYLACILASCSPAPSSWKCIAV